MRNDFIFCFNWFCCCFLSVLFKIFCLNLHYFGFILPVHYAMVLITNLWTDIGLCKHPPCNSNNNNSSPLKCITVSELLLLCYADNHCANTIKLSAVNGHSEKGANQKQQQKIKAQAKYSTCCSHHFAMVSITLCGLPG